MCENKNPYRFYRNIFVGKGVEGADNLGYMLSWCSTHPDLKPTQILEYYGNRFCAYCGEGANPIQADIERYNDYTVTGYTCSLNCEGSQNEIEFKNKIEDLKLNYNQGLHELSKEYAVKLKFDTEKLIKIKHSIDLQMIEREKKKVETNSYFSYGVNGVNFTGKSINDIL